MICTKSNHSCKKSERTLRFVTNPRISPHPPRPAPAAAGPRLSQNAKSFSAEREGFEPSIRFYPYSDLANRRTRPLCDLSCSRILSRLTPPFNRPRTVVIRPSFPWYRIPTFDPVGQNRG